MLDFFVLKIIWWVLIGAILMVYATTAGYDLGVTMIMPFLKDEIDRRVVLNTSAPTWDGNQTWLVFAGGALFVVWPMVYSTAFSGMYAAMLCILWGFFLRPPGYDYRSKIDHPSWRRFWDWSLFVSSVLPVFIFGVTFGNCLLGLPFHFDPISMRSFYTGNFFGLLNGFGLYTGVVAIVMILMHGSAYLIRRTEDALRETARKLHTITAILLLILFSISGYLMFHIQGYTLVVSPPIPTSHPLDNIVTHSTGAWIATYHHYTWKYFAPFLMYIGTFLSLWGNYFRWYATCFWGSVMGVSGVIGTAGATLFPFIMPSSTNPNESLTVWNAVSTQYALNTMLYVGAIILFIILAYKIFAFYSIWHDKGTISRQDVKDNHHTFY